LPRKIETHFLDGPAGKLEALLEEPETDPAEIAVACHPHPLYGGTMHNKVVYRLARGLRETGTVVLRFNFRGVGASEGTHGHGAGELEDARAALAWLRRRYPGLPVALAGFSFGARTILQAGCSAQGAARLIAAGYPTRFGTLGLLETCRAPKHFLQSTHDEYGPREALEQLVASLPEPKSLTFIESRDHFFAGGLEAFEKAVKALPRPT
jgi:uncharacterized protein